MRITIIAIGKRLPDWINAGVQEYSKRLQYKIQTRLVEITAEKRHKSSATDNIRNREAERIKATIPDRSFCIALDEKGKQLNTRRLADRLGDWIEDSQDVAFIIGGADGLDPSLLSQADEVWSLSNFTLPHALVRVFLTEQLYRALTILQGHPYHRDS